MFYLNRNGVNEENWEDSHFTEYGIEAENTSKGIEIAITSSLYSHHGTHDEEIRLFTNILPKSAVDTIIDLRQRIDTGEMGLYKLTFKLQELL